jgi:hypothetical protein
VSYAREALRAAVDDPSVLVNASVALSYFGEDVQAAMALMDRGLHANPSFAYGWLWSGVLITGFRGSPDVVELLGKRTMFGG